MLVFGVWIVLGRVKRELMISYRLLFLKIGLIMELFIVRREFRFRTKYNVFNFDYIC